MAGLTEDCLSERLRALGIDDNTRHNLSLFRPHLIGAIDAVVAEFYDHFQRIPSARVHFASPRLSLLKQRQRAHWLEMFEARFDATYAANAIRLGEAHFNSRVPPRLYLAGQSFFQCSIIALAAKRIGPGRDLPSVLASIARVIALDVDLAMSAYTRAFWSRPPREQEAASEQNVWL